MDYREKNALKLGLKAIVTGIVGLPEAVVSDLVYRKIGYQPAWLKRRRIRQTDKTNSNIRQTKQAIVELRNHYESKNTSE